MRKLKKKKGWNGMVVTENDFWRMGHEGKGKLIFKKKKKRKYMVVPGACWRSHGETLFCWYRLSFAR